MASRQRNLSGWISAILLAAITLSVFYSLRNSGPYSTLRRFHEAVLSKDINTINAVTIEGIEDPGVQILAQRVYSLADRGFKARSVNLTESSNAMVADVTYASPKDSGYFVSVWVLVRRSGQWRISAQDTINALQRTMMQP